MILSHLSIAKKWVGTKILSVIACIPRIPVSNCIFVLLPYSFTYSIIRFPPPISHMVIGPSIPSHIPPLYPHIYPLHTHPRPPSYHCYHKESLPHHLAGGQGVAVWSVWSCGVSPTSYSRFQVLEHNNQVGLLNLCFLSSWTFPSKLYHCLKLVYQRSSVWVWHSCIHN